MKKVKLIIGAVAMLSLVSSSAVYAGGYAPGEGLYVGAFFGHTAGHLAAKATTEDYSTSTLHNHAINEGGVGLSGVEGGGYLGYGYKMGDLYIGFEGGYASGGAKFEATSTDNIEVGGGRGIASGGTSDYTFNKVSAEANYTANVGGRLGVYLNADSLLSVSGGMTASEFDATWGSFSETYYAGGPRFGVAIETRVSAIDPNLSFRVETHFTDYMSASVNAIGTNQGRDGANDIELSGQAYGGRIGIQYSFFDANSLF